MTTREKMTAREDKMYATFDSPILGRATMITSLVFTGWNGVHAAVVCSWWNAYYVNYNGHNTFSLFFFLSVYFMIFGFMTLIAMGPEEGCLAKFRNGVRKICPMYRRHGHRAGLYAFWILLYSCSVHSYGYFGFGANVWWLSVIIDIVLAILWWLIIFAEFYLFLKKERGNKDTRQGTEPAIYNKDTRQRTEPAIYNKDTRRHAEPEPAI